MMPIVCERQGWFKCGIRINLRLSEMTREMQSWWVARLWWKEESLRLARRDRNEITDRSL